MQKHSRPIPDIGASPQCCIATSRKLPFAMNAMAGGGRIHTLRTKQTFVEGVYFPLRLRRIPRAGGIRKCAASANAVHQPVKSGPSSKNWALMSDFGHSGRIADLHSQCEGRIGGTPKRTVLVQDFHGYAAKKFLFFGATKFGGITTLH
jgi:hypothetical protein